MQLKWRGKISKSGDKYLVIIPKALHEMVESVREKTITISIEVETWS